MQLVFIGIHYRSSELGRDCLEKVITENSYNPFHYKSADVRSYFSPHSENTVLQCISLLLSLQHNQATFFLIYTPVSAEAIWGR